MPTYKYLIIGGGMTADAAVNGIRELDGDGSIGLISRESDPPYDRPPLSKGLWKGKPIEKIFRGTADAGATLHLGRKAKSLNTAEKRVTDDQGEEYTYDTLLLATGGAPRRLPFDTERDILYFRSLNDYRRLHDLTESKRRFAVIGGGFIGSEIAAALTNAGQEVTMLFPESGIGAVQFPADLSEFLNDYYREKGVTVQTGQMVTGIEKRGDRRILKTKDGQEIEADAVVAGIGIIPNVQLAEAAGLEVDGGIVVDEHVRTSHPSIYAAGDVASFYNPALGRRIRVEHEDNANSMGKLAGRNMAGADEPYHHLPFFYSDLFDLGYEAVGDVKSDLETVADWQEPFRKGIVYYLKDGRVRGVLLWDVWGKTGEAEKLIAEQGPFTANDLKGRISG